MDRQGSVWILPFWNVKVDEDMEFVTILEDWKGAFGVWGTRCFQHQIQVHVHMSTQRLSATMASDTRMPRALVLPLVLLL
jgi:hypothetical protein